jgi:shikimate dehydrogenase
MDLNKANLAKVTDGAEIVVNTTSVGMIPRADSTPLPTRYLAGKPVVFDIVYNPEVTRLRREAAAAGCVTIGGLDMLVRQGAIAFEMWTGQKPPEAIMKREALRVLEGK